MKILPDTSVMIPAFLKMHENHSKVMPWVHKILSGEFSGILSSHSLAETYSVLTRMPAPYRLSPEFAWSAIEADLPVFEIVALSEAEILIILRDLSARNIGGGSVYDALIVAVARKAEVDLILTFNINHFSRIAPDLADRIQEP